MARILICLDEHDKPGQLEAYHKEIEPGLTQAGHEVHRTTQAEVLDQIINLQADYLILFALLRRSTSWDIARRLREASQRALSDVPVLMFCSLWP